MALYLAGAILDDDVSVLADGAGLLRVGLGGAGVGLGLGSDAPQSPTCPRILQRS